MKGTTAQIYKSDSRGISEDESFKRLSIFNFEHHFDESRKPFGSLLALNEETLGAKHKIFRHVEKDTEIIIIPLAGALHYSDSLGNEDIIETEQIRIFSANDGMSYTLENPYGEDLVNFLQIWIDPAGNAEAGSQQQKFTYPGKNNLFPIFTGTPDDTILNIRQHAQGLLGIFDAHKQSGYTLQNPGNGLFVFAISGAFKCKDHSLETHDGLALSGLESVEFEALSENALLLVIETPMQSL
jgi:redox-sensitive bicupin YhaK (pirin superfamily)